MKDFFDHQEWLLVAAFFFGVILFISWLRRRDREWIEKRFSGLPVVAMSFGVNYFGKATEPGGPRRSSGFLLLLADRLFYRSRLARRELEIPGHRILRVYHDRSHKGVDLHQSLIKVDFYNEMDQPDSAAFRVPYPAQWIQVIETTLLGKGSTRDSRG